MRAYRDKSTHPDFRRKKRQLRQTGTRPSEGVLKQNKHAPLVSFNLWRSSQTFGSGSPSNIASEMATQEELKREKNKLIGALSRRDTCDWLTRQREKVASCRRIIRHNAHGTNVEMRSCSNRWCPYCSRKAADVRRDDLAYAFTAMEHAYPASKHFHGFITLTIDDKKNGFAADDVGAKVKAMRAELTRILNLREMKNRINIGCYYKIEATHNKETGRANIHAHIVMVCGSTRTQLESWLKKNYRLGRIIHVRKFEINGGKGVYEVSKGIASYLQKSFSVQTERQLFLMIYAFRNVKVNGATGCIRLFLKDAKIHREKISSLKPPPAPPEVDDGTSDLEHGSYSKLQLLYKIMDGSKTALECLKLLEYRMAYGDRYERARDDTGVEEPV